MKTIFMRQYRVFSLGEATGAVAGLISTDVVGNRRRSGCEIWTATNQVEN